MPRCTKCQHEIKELAYCGNHTVSSTFKRDRGYYNEYVEEWEHMTYTCPDCGFEIANNEDDALYFLRPDDKEGERSK